MIKALVLGSTGLTGRLVLEKILADDYFSEVTVWVRKNPGLTHPKLQVITTDFKALPESSAHVVFSCLGTTRKKTPDPERYRFIEVSIPVNTAESLLPESLQQFHYISSMGTSAGSRGSYLQNKWAAESALNALNIPALYLYRPSLIYGDRKETRLAEGIFNTLMILLNPLLAGKLKKYRRISAETIAEAMVRNAKRPVPGTHVVESDKIQETGRAEII